MWSDDHCYKMISQFCWNLIVINMSGILRWAYYLLKPLLFFGTEFPVKRYSYFTSQIRLVVQKYKILNSFKKKKRNSNNLIQYKKNITADFIICIHLKLLFSNSLSD